MITEIQPVSVVSAKQLPGQVLLLRFSTGESGEISLAGMIGNSGAMIETMRNSAIFELLFIEPGVAEATYCFDIDTIELHIDMRE